MNKKDWAERQDEKAANVERNRAAREARTPQQQLEVLDKRPGESRRERERLNKLLG